MEHEGHVSHPVWLRMILELFFKAHWECKINKPKPVRYQTLNLLASFIILLDDRKETLASNISLELMPNTCTSHYERICSFKLTL